MRKLLELLSRMALCSAFIATTTLCAVETSAQNSNHVEPSQPKAWNWMVYMCNNNNLHRFGIQNFREMVQAGSTSAVNVLLQMDDIGATSIKRFYIEQNNPVIIEAQSNTNSSYSGTPQNLFEFAQWGINHFPSEHTCLVLWNHGSGIKDPSIWDRMIMRWRDDLFVFNHKTGLLELNRSFKQNKDLIDALKTFSRERGIAFNDAAETYLNNDDLKKSLAKISTELLGGKKLDILAMDACHMAMVEIASEVKESVKIITASEEVEPGAGYDYSLLKAFSTQSFDGKELAKHIVNCYQDRYQDILGDYTQSAIDLTYINELESHMKDLATCLIELLSQGNQETVKAIRKIRFNYTLSTEFLDNDYIDLNHLLKSLTLVGSAYVQDQEKLELGILWGKTAIAASNAIATLKKMIIANVAGVNLPDAAGLAVYFPTSMIHASYYKTDFAKITGWAQFLEKFIRTRKEVVSAVPVRDVEEACCHECEEGKECAGEKKNALTNKKKYRTCVPCQNARLRQKQKQAAKLAKQKQVKATVSQKQQKPQQQPKPSCACAKKHPENVDAKNAKLKCSQESSQEKECAREKHNKHGKKKKKKGCTPCQLARKKHQKATGYVPQKAPVAPKQQTPQQQPKPSCACSQKRNPEKNARCASCQREREKNQTTPGSVAQEQKKTAKPCCDDCAQHAKKVEKQLERCACNRPQPAPYNTVPEKQKQKQKPGQKQKAKQKKH